MKETIEEKKIIELRKEEVLAALCPEKHPDVHYDNAKMTVTAGGDVLILELTTKRIKT